MNITYYRKVIWHSVKMSLCGAFQCYHIYEWFLWHQKRNSERGKKIVDATVLLGKVFHYSFVQISSNMRLKWMTKDWPVASCFSRPW